MRCMTRNKVKLYYALLNGKTEMRDDEGFFTGEERIEYGKPRMLKANVSAAMGETYTRQFGEQEDYDKVVIVEDPNCLIDEYAVLWIDTMPRFNKDKTTDTPHDYVVKKVARSLNVASYAVAKVKVK